MLKKALLRLERIVIAQCLHFIVFESFWAFIKRAVVNIDIIVFEATKPVKAHYFT